VPFVEALFQTAPLREESELYYEKMPSKENKRFGDFISNCTLV
jgi:hypothetical protein